MMVASEDDAMHQRQRSKASTRTNVTSAGSSAEAFDNVGTLPVTSTTTGASLKELMARLGHSSTRAALIYQHATRDRDQAIAKALGGLVREVRNPGPSTSGKAVR